MSLVPTSMQATVAWLLPAWFGALLIYRVFFHPLAKYPGPLLAKLTGWYEFPSVAAGTHHLWLQQHHEKYGSVVRIGPNRLSYNTTEGLQAIYGDRKANIKKAGFVESIALLKGGGRNLQTIQDRHAYAARRRLISHAFSEEALRSSEDYILDRIQIWFKVLSSRAAAPGSWTSDVDMGEWAVYLMEDILGELCFGEAFGACEKGFSSNGKFAVEGAAQAQILSAMPFGPTFFRLIKLYVDTAVKNKWDAVKSSVEYDAAIDAMIARRMQSTNESRKDFFHYILQAKDAETGEQITPGGMTVEAGVLFGAGFDTSATCIAACLFYLTRNPAIMAKLVAEIRNTFTHEDEIRHGPKLNSLVYLRACIDEALRMSPPVPGPLLREATTGGAMVAGDYLPAGTQMSVPIYAIHHNETYFPDSWTFKPERWLDGSKLANKEAFCAFSLGARVCIGRNLAYLDMTLVLSRLLFSFDVRAAPGNRTGEGESTNIEKIKAGRGRVDEYQLEDWFITGRKGPIIQLKARS